MERRVATIYDVARAAGVSAATVSRVLNDHKGVDPELAERVRLHSERLGYERNEVARNLRRKTTSLWAAIVSDVANPFFTSVVRGIEDVASSAGYSVVLCNSDEDIDKENRYIAAAVAARMGGVIISPALEDRTDIAPLLRNRIPVVSVDRRLSTAEVDTVLVDNREGAYAATAHLVELGYRRIACITGPRTIRTAVERVDGYRAALRHFKVPVRNELIRYSDYRHAGGNAAMLALLAAPEPPDAVFVANNLMTLGALAALHDRRLDASVDIGIVGFDAIPWPDLAHPSLTTVLQPTYRVGVEAGNLLADRIAHPDAAARVVTLPTELQVRQAEPLVGT
jgi:LacI family transcriptional regulator